MKNVIILNLMAIEFNKTGVVSELQNTNQKATPKEVIKANNFFDWFQNLGGNLVEFNAENVIISCTETFNKISSFKNRSTEVKEKYNHKFNF